MATEAQSPPRTALVAGATGLTGAVLLQRLLRAGDYARVHAVTRRPLLADHPRLANRILPQFAELEARLAGLRCQDAFCCLGAARGPAADPAALRQVDVELVLACARVARAAGAARFVVVSAAGAERNATGAFLKAKGEMEQELRALGFASLDILQPGRVVGMRAGDGLVDLARTGLAPLLNPLLRGRRAAQRAFSADELAAAMLAAGRSQRRGVYAYAGDSLRQLAAAGRDSA